MTLEQALAELGEENAQRLAAISRRYGERRAALLQAGDKETIRRLDRAFGVVRDHYWAAISTADAEAASAKKVAAADAERAREAERQAREEREALVAAALAAEQAENVSAGWPTSWSPAQVRRWTAARGGLEAARGYGASGWGREEILDLLDYPEVELNQAPPVRTAATYRIHGDTLASLLSHEWPSPPDDTIFSLKRTLRSGIRQRWTISKLGDRLRLRQHSVSRTGTWRIVRDEDAGTDVVGAIAATATLCHVRHSAINEYTLDPSSAAGVNLLDLLRVSAAAGDEKSDGWPKRFTDKWSRSDDSIDDFAHAVPTVNRWCTINGHRLIALKRGKGAYAVLVDLTARLATEDALGATEVAHYTWNSESGGAPISWDGGNSLSVLGPLLWVRQWGDDGDETELRNLPKTPRSWVGVIADWVVSIGAEVPTAFSLEPFDPNKTLEVACEELWDRRFESVDASIYFNFDADVVAHLRRRLVRSSPLYRQARDALLRPRGKDGRALGAALDALLDDGVLGPLIWGHWGE